MDHPSINGKGEEVASTGREEQYAPLEGIVDGLLAASPATINGRSYRYSPRWGYIVVASAWQSSGKSEKGVPSFIIAWSGMERDGPPKVVWTYDEFLDQSEG